MKTFITSILVVFVIFLSVAQEPLNYFLPNDVNYNKEIPTPEQFFNQQVGEWHLTHDQILFYMKEIAKTSNRAILYEYARTYENRPLVHLIFTSEENHKNLDKLKALHYNYSEPGENIDKKDVPVVVSLTYGVHGNESSGPNSSVLTAYYLAAAEGEKINQLLDKNIIIVDPCLNPDGLVRHSTWANTNQGITATGNNDSRQYDEVWPGGRTNHYWFDLNRDYLLLVHPESRGRVAKFHEWKPNIVTDHHEMSANSTFFFQPGVPSRNNPLTPEKNYELTHEIAKYHSKFLDKIGAQYYSEEQYDDYYFGKGSSYPDINASIGILFEQAGFRGKIRETSNGLKKLAFGIRNQFTVSLSTLEAAMNMHDDLLDLQKEFYQEAFDLADKDEIKAYVFGDVNDQFKTQNFISLLNQHQIKVYPSEKTISLENQIFEKEKTFIVPLKQKQYRLIKSIFEEVTTFSDTTFYDVSTWTFPYAFNIPFARLKSTKDIQMNKQNMEAKMPVGKIIGGKSKLAYVFRWNEFKTPEALYQIQKSGLITKVADEKFQYIIENKTEEFTYGTVLIPVAEQRLNSEQIHQLVSQIAAKTGVDFYGLSTGLSPVGIDMGSGSFSTLTQPEILLFVGGGVSSRDAGELWHLFDQHYHIPVTLCETSRLSSIDLNRYTSIILPGGYFSEWDKNEIEKLKSWASKGGTIVAYKSSANWAAQNNFGKVSFKKSVEPDTTQYLKYAERGKERSFNYLSGSIFQTKIDLTHPLCYGYLNENLAVFKSATSVANSLQIKYAEPVQYTSNPYISGWVSPGNLERIKNSPVVSVQSIGRGKIISYYDNMYFRGIWLGTSKLFVNSVFFGDVIQ